MADELRRRRPFVSRLSETARAKTITKGEIEELQHGLVLLLKSLADRIAALEGQANPAPVGPAREIFLRTVQARIAALETRTRPRRMQKRIIRNADGLIERVVEEPEPEPVDETDDGS